MGEDARAGSPARADRPPRRPTDQVTPRTLTGTLDEVAGTTVLVTDGGTWALEGPAVGPALGPGRTAGARVTVVGRPAPEAESPTGHPVLRVRELTDR